MDIQKEQLENSQIKLTITVDAERIEKAKREAARSLSREVNIPGFRKGKAPYSMIARYVGEQTLFQEAVEHIAPDIISEAIDEADIDVWSYEDIEPNIESLDPLTLEVLVPTVPTVELGDIDAIDVERDAVEVNEDEVEETVEALRERQATWMPATGPAEYGDRLTLDLEGHRLDGETVVQMEGEEIQLQRMFEDEDDEDAASEIVLPGQQDDVQEHRPDIMAKLKGMKVNETREFSLQYPDDWGNERMAGRTIMYTATLLDLKKQVLPELDAEFAQNVGEFEDMDDLRDQLRENIRAEAEQEREEQFLMEILDGLVESSNVSYPPAMLNRMVESRIEETKQQFYMYGLTFEQFLQMNDQTEEEFEQDIHESVQRDIERGLVISEYGRIHDIRINDDELQREVGLVRARLSRQGQDESVVDDEDVQEQIAERLLSRKILNKLRAEVTGEPEEPLFPVEEEDVLEGEAEAAVTESDLEIEIAAEDLGMDIDDESDEDADG